MDERSKSGATMAQEAARHPPVPVSSAIHQRCGQALVELALCMGVLLLLVLGGVDCLQVVMTNATVGQAVRAAAHQAALIGGPDGQDGSWGEAPLPTGTVATTAEGILQNGMVTTPANATITVTCARTPCRRYDPITVRIQYRDAVWAPVPGVFREVVVDLSATRLAEQDRQ